jgi:hypothetical protein
MPVRSAITLFLLCLAILSSPAYAATPACRNYGGIRSSGPLRLAVRLDISDPSIRQQFRRAMDFWAQLLDLEWRAAQTPDCAIRVIYGPPVIFDSDDLAQADDPDSPAFRGEIAFNPTFTITPREAYLVSIHEIGHLLGLDHNPSPASVMHAVGLEGSEQLEISDISALAARHRLRSGPDAQRHRCRPPSQSIVRFRPAPESLPRTFRRRYVLS